MKKTNVEKISNKYKYILGHTFSPKWFILEITFALACFLLPIGTYCFFSWYYPEKRDDLNKLYSFLVIRLGLIVFSIGSLLTINILLRIFIIICGKYNKKSFFLAYFSKNTWITSLALFFIALSNSASFLLYLCDKIISNEGFDTNLNREINEIYNILNDQELMTKITKRSIYFYVVLFVTLFENIIRYYVEYSIYHNCFRKNLIKCRRSIDCIETIEIKKEGTASKNVLTKEDIADLYKYITDKNFIEYEDIRNIYDRDEDAKMFFDLFDVNNDKIITKNEFIIRFKEIQNRYYNSILAYKKSMMGIHKLQFIIFPLGLYIGLSVVHSGHENNSFGAIFAAFASLSFMIGPAFADLFRNIFQTFLSRPFDVSDTIFFRNKEYIVKDLGFLYTKLECDGSTVFVANECFKKDPITNLRNASKFPARIKVYVSSDFDNSSLKKFNLKIEEYIEKHKNKIKRTYKITDFRYKDDRGYFVLIVYIFMHEINLDYAKIQKEKIINSIMQHKSNLNLLLMV